MLKKKRVSKRIYSVFLTQVIILLLIFSGPTSAITIGLDRTDSNGSDIEKGTILTYRAVVDIHDSDFIKMDHLTFMVKRGTQEVLCNYSLAGAALLDYSESQCNAINITDVEANLGVYSLGYGYDFGYGFGRNASNNWGVSNFRTGPGSGFGYVSGVGYDNYTTDYYGYGYAPVSGIPGEIVILFKINTQKLRIGNYNIRAGVTANGTEAGKQFTFYSSADSYALSPVSTDDSEDTGDSTSGGGGGSGSSGDDETEDPATPTKITTREKTVSITKGISTKFTYNDEEHSIKIDEIGNGYAIFTISSTPKTLNLNIGATEEIDLDDDGDDDISVKLIGIDGNTIDLGIKDIGNEQEPPITGNTVRQDTTNPDQNTNTQNNQNNAGSNQNIGEEPNNGEELQEQQGDKGIGLWPYYLILLVVIIAIVSVALVVRKRKEEDKGYKYGSIMGRRDIDLPKKEPEKENKETDAYSIMEDSKNKDQNDIFDLGDDQNERTQSFQEQPVSPEELPVMPAVEEDEPIEQPQAPPPPPLDEFKAEQKLIEKEREEPPTPYQKRRMLRDSLEDTSELDKLINKARQDFQEDSLDTEEQFEEDDFLDTSDLDEVIEEHRQVGMRSENKQVKKIARPATKKVKMAKAKKNKAVKKKVKKKKR